MIRLVLAGTLLCGGLMAEMDFDQVQAARFAQLALDCVHKQYPNKIAHSLNSDADVRPPRTREPVRHCWRNVPIRAHKRCSRHCGREGPDRSSSATSKASRAIPPPMRCLPP